MMTRLKKFIPLILCSAALMLQAAPEAEVKAPEAEVASIYDVIKSQLSGKARVPGTEEYKAAIKIIKDAYAAHGITLHEQIYPTLVPKVVKKEFYITKGDKQEKIEFYPLAPNNAALISTGEKPLEGPIVYISSERLKNNDFGHVDGKIVLLDWGEHSYSRIFFPEGAKAIVFVGNDNAKQWDIAKLLSQYNIAFPYFYIQRSEAEKHGLLSATPEVKTKDLPTVSIVCHTQWEQVEGVNLWAEIKGSDPQEAMFLNARLDSFGAVPGLDNGERQLENLALLAETAVGLSQKQPKNSVFIVMYGSSFNAYDGLRFFYYPIFKHSDENAPKISQFTSGFEQELADNREKLKILENPTQIVREKTEYTAKQYTQISGITIGVLIIAIGLFLVGVIFKKRFEKVQFKQKRYTQYASGIIAIGLVILLFFTLIFDASMPPAQEEVLKKQLIQKEAEINQVKAQIESTRLAISSATDEAAKAALRPKLNELETRYYTLLNEYDEIQKYYYDGKEGKAHDEIRKMLRSAVIKEYNDRNHRLAEINLQLRKFKEQLKTLDGQLKEHEEQLKKLEEQLKKSPQSSEVSAQKERVLAQKEKVLAQKTEVLTQEAALTKEKADLDSTKKEIANMRKLINERMISKPEERKLLNTFVVKIHKDLEERQKELELSIKMGKCWTEIAEATAQYGHIRGIYYFDLATADAPFFFATRTYEALHYSNALDASNYNNFFKRFKDALKKMQPATQAAFLTESLTNSDAVNTLSSLSLVYLPHAASLPLAKTFSTTMRSVTDAYDYDELPGSQLTYDLKAMAPIMVDMFSVLAKEESLSHKDMTTMFAASKVYDVVNYYYDHAPFGERFDILAADGKEIDGPAAGMIALIQQNEYDRILPMAGFSQVAMGRINQIGYTTMPLLTGGGRWGKENFKLHRSSIGFDEFGHVKYISRSGAEGSKLFRAYGGPHFYPYAPLTSNFAGSLSLVNGFTDGAFKNSRTYARVATGDGYAYADTDIKSKLYFFNETFMLGKVTKDQPTGDGISIAPEHLKNLNVNRIAIDNTIQLNLQRLEKLHSRNIFNSVVEMYHDKAEVHYQAAQEARKQGNLNLARAHEIFGQTLAVQAYRPLKGLIEDLVKSVLILLILTIPFSFALERLLIGATNIYKQMAWILVFFLATFLMLYFTHPAFAMSQSPMIIFIAFFIIVMSVMVIYIVMSRFKSELLAMQGMDTSAHRVNSENSMLLAAIMIGVSSMRNRPVKTFLTILTVVLLTFTIISFASFDSTKYVRPVYMGSGSGEQRIESFLPQHVDLLEPLCQSMKELYKDNYHVYYRSASYNSPFYMLPTYPSQENVIYNPNFFQYKMDDEGRYLDADGKVTTDESKRVLMPQAIILEAVVGFEPGETLHSEKLGNLMVALREKTKAEEAKKAEAEKNGKEYVAPAAEEVPGVYLSKLRAESLGLKVGDEFYLRTMKVRLDGVFDAKALDDFTYLDNGKVTPPNFKQTASAEAANIFTVLNNSYVDASNFIWSSPDLTLLTDYETAKKINGFVNAVIFYPKSDEIDIRKDATDIAEVTFGIVYSNTASNGVERHFMADIFEASGLSNLLVPLLLGALIILSSLLGSIADREREIFTFSALGLSPKDVSCLFFAESSVYAVIGGLGGYLLSQVTNAVLTALAKRGILEAPEMNFSSMTTVYTILIVMAIVLLSTIYPAIKAGRAASPDVARKWKMPPPDGDVLCFQFPFTVSRVDFGGILVFISEHFANHADSSLGSFAASNIRITHGKNELTDGYMLTADFTLAPFDLGVAEEMSMYSAPSDIEGIDVVTVRIIRKDGSKGAWLRGNNRFVGEIRNQFLLWRSLPVETVMHYRELAAAKLNTTANAEGEQA